MAKIKKIGRLIQKKTLKELQPFINNRHKNQNFGINKNQIFFYILIPITIIFKILVSLRPKKKLKLKI